MTHTEYFYEILKEMCDGMDSVYEDYIIEIIGLLGLKELRGAGYLETCGVINGRQLYVLVEKK